MDKAKVLVFTTAYHPFIGGAEVSIQETVRRLKDRFDFCIVTHRINRQLPREEVYKGAKVFRLGWRTKLDRLFVFPFLAFGKGLKLLGGSRVILWGVMVSYASLGALFIKIICPRTPFVLTLQEGDPERYLKWGKFGLVGAGWWVMLKFVDEVTAISTYLGDLACRRGYQGRAELIHNGVDLKVFENPRGRQGFLDVRHKIIITTSRLVYKNGIDILLKSIAKVKKDFPEVRCEIIGDGPERKSLEKLAKSLDLEKEVVFLGQIPYEKIPYFLHKASVFVRPSRSEGMGNSFVEAIAAGLPIIGTPMGGITDIIENGKTGIFSKVNDPEDLARAIRRVLKDVELAQGLVANGKEMIAESFSWDKIAASYGQIFSRLLGRKSLKILIATPIFPPQFGGPALYAKELGDEFKKQGQKVKIANFGFWMKYPSLLRHLFYFLAVLPKVYWSEVVLSLDYFSVGVPLRLAVLVFRRPVILRLEGDFLWERFVEKHRREITLSEFYRRPPRLNLGERLIKWASIEVIRSVNIVVFSSAWRKKMFAGILSPTQRVLIINNAWPSYDVDILPRKRVVLWAGRMLFLKNLERLIKALTDVNSAGYEIHIVGDGPERKNLEEFVRKQKISRVLFFPAAPHSQIVKKLSTSAFLVLPSLSEVGPNIIAEAAATHTPFIMTKESGYTEYVKDFGVLVDPLSDQDLADKIKLLMEEKQRLVLTGKMRQYAPQRDWPLVAQEWLNILRLCSNS